MRIRTVKPEFWASESMGRLRRDSRLLFVGLWSLADDHGLFRADPRFVAGQLFPYDTDALKTVEKGLRELVDEGSVVLYEAGGSSYGAITGWEKHQRIDRKSKPKLPTPSESGSIQVVGGPILASPRGALVEGSVQAREPSSQDQGRDQGSGKGRDQGAGSPPPAATRKPKKPKQVELPDVVPPAPPKPSTPAAQVYEWFLEAREWRLEELGLKPDAHPDDEPNWPRTGAAVGEWMKLSELIDIDQPGAISYAKSFVDKYLADPWPAGLMRRDAEGKDTTTPQPYPWHVLLSEKVWRKYHAQIEADFAAPRAGVH